jgi:hypothetical protein
MFSNILKLFKKTETTIVGHTHKDLSEFIKSFNDSELNTLNADLISCPSCEIEQNIEEMMFYLKERCSKEDYEWFCQEIRKEYKK